MTPHSDYRVSNGQRRSGHINTLNLIQGASKILRKDSGVRFPHGNNGKVFILIYVRKQVVFEVQPNIVLFPIP